MSLALPSLLFSFFGFGRENIPLLHPVALLIELESALFTALLLVAIYWTVLRSTGQRWLAVLALLPWVVFFTVDLVAIWVAGMRFESSMLDWSSFASVTGFFTPAVCGLIVLPVSLICMATRHLGVLQPSDAWRSIYRLWLAVVVLGLLQPAYLCYRTLTAPIPARFLALSRSIWGDAEKYRTDPVFHALKATLAPSPYRLVKSLSPREAALAQEIGIAPRPEPASLPPGKPYKRVIFLTCESLTLSFIGHYNPAMPASLTPFIDSLPEGFSEFWACSFPTNAGLTTHYCSHPNYLAVSTNRYPNSFVKQLASTGWRTVIFRSAAMSFDSGHRRFSEIGFQELFGAEWHEAQGRGRYVSGWGACDRISFLSAIDYLKAHRSERVFLSVMTADMHMPHGRENYGDLTYLPPPGWVKGHEQERLLTAISRFDQDLKLFFDGLKAAGLFNEDTLVVVTADHAFPSTVGLDSIPGVNLEYFQRIPFIVVSGQPLPEVDHKRLASQTATAPTFAALLGLPPLPGWWGKNLFARDYIAPVFVASDGSSVAIEPDIDPRLSDESNVAAAKAMIQVIESKPLDEL